MPIKPDLINTPVIVVRPTDQLFDIYKRITSTNIGPFSYVVAPLEQNKYLVMRWDEVEEAASNHGGNPYTLTLNSVAGDSWSVGAERMTTTSQDAESMSRKQPAKKLVVLEAGKVVGVVARVSRGGDSFHSMFAREAAAFELPADASSEEKGPPQSGVLHPSKNEVVKQPVKPTAPANDPRVINAWIDGHDKDEPLELDTQYELRFDVSTPRADAIGQAGGIKELVENTNPDQTKIEVLVVLVTSDFDIEGASEQKIAVPRAIKPSNKVTFTIVPKTTGTGTITALFLAQAGVFQRMVLKLQVGQPVVLTRSSADQPTMDVASRSGRSLGAALASVARVQSVDLMIVKREPGYQFIAQSGGVSRAVLNITDTKIADLVKTARKELLDVVFTDHNGIYSYQQANTTIDPEVHKQTLQKLAKIGFRLYQELFYGSGNGPDARSMGNLLRRLSQTSKLNIQIASDRFVFPWALLYDQAEFDPDTIVADSFWGFKHVLQYLPEYSVAEPMNFSPSINVAEKLQLGFVVNDSIDDELKTKGFATPVIAPQRAFLQGLQGVTYNEYTTSADLYKLLKNADSPVQMLYFYCHAESSLPGEGGGVDDSRIILSDGALPLSDLKVFAPLSGDPLKSAPLVFLNACESAELSPYLYDGLVPYLITKGARGVIGTEVMTPALFAAEFAQTFMGRFVLGDTPLGELLLQLRREYLLEKNNVMGLVYALYSSGDVIISRG